MKQLFKQIFILILAVSVMGCDNDDDGKLPEIIPGYTQTINDQTGTVTFINISENSGSYLWTFGDGTTSTEINPMKTFDPGTYTVILQATNAGGETKTFSDTFTISGEETPPAGGECTAETTESLSAADFNLTFMSDPDSSIGSFDAVLTRVSNPDSDNAVNPSCQVGQIDRNGGALFANNQIELDTKLDFNANAGFKMKVWSPVAGTKVLVKLEDLADTAIFAEVEATTTTAGAWEELTFDFASSESNKYDNIILFFELNTNTTETYYIDDFALYAGTGGGDCIAETTESLSAADFNLTFATDPGSAIGSFGADLTTVDNPATDSVNGSCKVGQIVRSADDQFANNQIVLDAKLDFSANAGFKMKVWSPSVDTSVLVKLEAEGILSQVEAVTTKSGEWEELTFEFGPGDNGTYDLIVLFFEVETNTAETYYIDDFALYPREVIAGGTNLITNGDFETGDVSGWNGDTAGNSGTFAVSDINSKCGVYSANIAVNEAQLQIITQANIGVGVVTPNSEITLSFDLRGTAGTGGEFIPLLFSNSSIEAVGVTKTDPLDGPIQPNETWTRYTYTTTAGPDVSAGLTLLLQGVCGAVADCSADVYIDNVYLGLGDGSGPNDCVPTNGTASVGVTDVTVNEAVGTATFAVRLSGADVSGGFTVDYATADGTAVQPDDYTSTSGTLTFAGTNGETQNIVVPIIDDTLEELLESFVVNLSNTSVEIGTAQATGNISSNDGAITELTTNGDFETGDLTGWTLFVDAAGASFEASDAEASDGTFSGYLTSDFNAGIGGAVDAVVKQANVGVGTVTPNTDYIVSFDLRGFSGTGGDLFVEFFSELSGGGTSAAEILSNGPLTPTDTWTPYSFTVTTGDDVSGGITLQLKTSCGPVLDCVVEGYFDNVSIELAE